MPYVDMNDPKLPDTVQAMADDKRQQWVAVFNDAFENCDGGGAKCEGAAFAAAYGAVKEQDPPDTADNAVEELVEAMAEEEDPEEEETQQGANLGAMIEFDDIMPLIQLLVEAGYIALSEAGAATSPLGKVKQFLIGTTPDMFNNPSGFKVLPNNRWLAWYTNSYKDKEGEWFATEAIEADIEYMLQSKDLPELWFWHMKGTRHGQADAVVGHGRFAIAVGHFDETPIAKQLKQYYLQNPRTLSHGFFYDPEAFVDNVYHKFHTFEISTLPPTKEANQYTSFEVEPMTTPLKASVEQITELSKALGGDASAVISVLSEANKVSQALDEKAEFKSQGDGLTPALVTEFKSAIAEALAPLTDRLTQLESKMSEGDKPKPDDEGKMSEEGEDEEENKAFKELVAALTKAMGEEAPPPSKAPEHKHYAPDGRRQAILAEASNALDFKAQRDAIMTQVGEPAFKAFEGLGIFGE